MGPVDWQSLFLLKSGDERIRPGIGTVTADEGFVTFEIQEPGILDLIQVAGERVWCRAQVIRLMEFYRCPRVRFHTRRNPDGFIRRFPGLRLVRSEADFYVLEGELSGIEYEPLKLRVSNG